MRLPTKQHFIFIHKIRSIDDIFIISIAYFLHIHKQIHLTIHTFFTYLNNKLLLLFDPDESSIKYLVKNILYLRNLPKPFLFKPPIFFVKMQ